MKTLPAGFSRRHRDLLAFRVLRSLAAGAATIAFPYFVLPRYGALTLGILYASAAVATAALGWAVGHISDAWGRKKTLLAVGALMPAGSLMVYASRGLPLLFAGTIVAGISATGSLAGGGVGGAVQPVQSAVVAEITPHERRTFWFSAFAFTSGVSGAIGALLARLFDARTAFLAAAALSLLGVLFLLDLRLTRQKPAALTESSRATIGRFAVTGALNGLSQGLVVPFLIPFFVLVYHVPQSRMAVYGFGSGLAAALALLASWPLERRLGFVGGVAASRGLGAALLLLLPFSPWFPLALAIFLVTPALRVVSVPLQQSALTARVDESEFGRALGWSQVSRLGASSLGTALTGYLFDAARFAAPFCAYAAIMGANIALYYRFFARKEKLS